MGFKENLRDELNFQGILIKELAEKTGISRRTIDNYLRENASDPQVSTAVKIAQALGVSVEYLVTGKEGKTKFSKSQNDINLIANESKKLSAKERKVVIDLITSLRTHLE